jgi:hypothetical protein
MNADAILLASRRKKETVGMVRKAEKRSLRYASQKGYGGGRREKQSEQFDTAVTLCPLSDEFSLDDCSNAQARS